MSRISINPFKEEAASEYLSGAVFVMWQGIIVGLMMPTSWPLSVMAAPADWVRGTVAIDQICQGFRRVTFVRVARECIKENTSAISQLPRHLLA